MIVFVQTDRLMLRRFTTDDVDLLVALDNDPAVMQFINAGAPVERSEVVAYLDDWLNPTNTTGAFGFWAAIEREPATFIGWFHLLATRDGPPDAELGYRLHRAAWGQGLATEGSRALIDRAFSNGSPTPRPLQRIHAETMAVHVASRRVMEKAGLRYVRTFDADWPVRIPGDEQGDVEYAIDRARWEADRGWAD